MIKTKVTEMLGCKYPIIVGTMSNITTPEFVAACSNAGACAVLAAQIIKLLKNYEKRSEKHNL